MPTNGSPCEPRRIRVEIPGDPYDVCIGDGLLASLAECCVRSLVEPGRAVMLVRDMGIPEAQAGVARRSLEQGGYRVVEVVARAGEAHKTLDDAEGILRGMSAARLDRDDLLIALGGGVVGDLAAFAASVYRRGIRFINAPTTLLSMVDASVGGKTGVNLAMEGDMLAKNMVGTFHQPRTVVADVRTLASLEEREYRSGLGECLKHAMIAEHAGVRGLDAWTRDHLEAIASREFGTLVELVARNVEVKARIVEADPHERAHEGGRALLNLGHTFAHAIETLDGVGVDAGPGLLHGEAVGLGLIAAAATGESLGAVTEGWCARVRERVARAGLPIEASGLPDSEILIDRMGMDKKVRGGVLRIVVPDGEGTARVVSQPSGDALMAGWDAIRARG